MTSFLGRMRILRRVDRALDDEVRQALVETLYASTSSLVVGAVAGTGVAAIVASQAHDVLVTLCAGAIGAVATVRVASAISYHRLLKAADHSGASRWERIYELGAWSYSALLGLLAWLTLVRHDDPALHLVTTGTAIGYAAGICGRNSGRPKIAISQLALAALPAAAGLLLSPGLLYRTLGVATVAFVLAMIEIILQLYDVVRRAIVTTNEKQKAAETLQLALTAAEAANLAKSSFLTTMSHEIRTPLNGVLGMAQTLTTEPLTPAQKERVEIIRQSGETLLAILNDVLDLAKVEAGKFELEEAPFDLEELLSTVHQGFSDVAAGKGLDLSVALEPGAGGWCLGDRLRLRQIVNNLVSNAVKFTAEGSVSLNVRRDGETLQLSVRDTGIGISEAHLAKVFEKFLQADASTTRQFGGTGLGLALCKELAGLMGGGIEVRSRMGEGSEFTVSLPLPRVCAPADAGAVEAQAGPAALAEPEMAVEHERLRVLCAEDNEVNRLVLRTLLDQIGVDHLIVENGAEAVDAWESGRFDLILMDVQMPVMDGVAASAAIRQRERTMAQRRTPIIALTANVMAHQTTQYLTSGMDDVVAKPINLGDLFAAIHRQLEEPAATEAAVRQW